MKTRNVAALAVVVRPSLKCTHTKGHFFDVSEQTMALKSSNRKVP